jgi:hypothetical protein
MEHRGCEQWKARRGEKQTPGKKKTYTGGFFKKKKHSPPMPNPWLVASAASMLVPATLSFFRQSALVFIIITCSTLYSMLYHVMAESDRYELIDVIFACMAVTLGLVAMAVNTMYYPWYHWRILVPVVFSAVALMFFMLDVCDKPPGSAESCAEFNAMYVWSHSSWHVSLAIAATAMFWTRVHLGDIVELSYYDVMRNIADPSAHVNRESLKSK